MYRESKAMKEIREIRDRNYEDIKNMTSKEMTEYFRNKSEKVEQSILDVKKINV